MLISFVLFMALLGGIASRMCGSDRLKIGFGLEQWIYALPYLVVPYLAVYPHFNSIDLAGSVALICYFGAVLGKRTGHGNFFDLGRAKRGDDEASEFIIKWLHGRIGEYWYDVIGLALTGLAVTLLPAVALYFYSPIFALAVLLSGFLGKPLSYMFSYALHDWAVAHKFTKKRRDHEGKFYSAVKFLPKEFDHNNAIAEFLTGFIGWGALCILI